MGYKVYDYLCEACGDGRTDELVFIAEDGTEEAIICPSCGEIMQRLIPAPHGNVYDAKQIAEKKALMRSYRLKAEAQNYRRGSEERKEVEAAAQRLQKIGET